MVGPIIDFLINSCELRISCYFQLKEEYEFDT